MLACPVSEGDILAERYRVERVLGLGGMGVVVAAVHTKLDQRVAIKFLRPEASAYPALTARFLREAKAAAKIRSEHVGRVTDFGTLDSGAPYMVMEYLEGQDLSSLVNSRGPLPIADAVEYVLQACEGIAEAHATGVVHRDIKGANLFLTYRSDKSPVVKVLDFGISKATQPEDPEDAHVNMTTTGMILGSPTYMSPEQVRSSKDIDGRTDIWSLGVVLHELLTGTTVFEASTVPALLAMIAADPPRSLRSIREDVPPGLEQVVLKCLAKPREQRYSNVGELARALEPFAPARAVVHVARACSLCGATVAQDQHQAQPECAIGDTGSVKADSMVGSAVSRTSGSVSPSQRRPWSLAAAALAGVCLVAGYWVYSSQSTPVRHESSAAPSTSRDQPETTPSASSTMRVEPVTSAAVMPTTAAAAPSVDPRPANRVEPMHTSAKSQSPTGRAKASSAVAPGSPNPKPTNPSTDRGANPF